jgi:hypothetical protein
MKNSIIIIVAYIKKKEGEQMKQIVVTLILVVAFITMGLSSATMMKDSTSTVNAAAKTEIEAAIGSAK